MLRRAVKNRVLLVLVIAAAGSAWGLPFLTVAPNRLVSGTAIFLAQISDPWRDVLVLPAALLVFGIFLPQRQRLHGAVAVAAPFGLAYLAGAHAARVTETVSAMSRTALGAGFWLLALLTWLAAVDAIERLRLSPAIAGFVHLTVLFPVVALLFAGGLEHLSLLREYATRRDVFIVAFVRHVEIVAAALLPTLLVGIPLGIALFRRATSQAPVFAVLNVIQTVPSIALFGLLMVPLALLATALPHLRQLGISGIGMAPAVIALVLYSLLPVVRSTVAGLVQVPQAVVEAAAGMGVLAYAVRLALVRAGASAGLRLVAVVATGAAVYLVLLLWREPQLVADARTFAIRRGR